MLGIAISAVLFMGLVLPAHAQIEKSDLYIGLLLDFRAEATNAERDLALLQEEIHKVLGVDKSVHFLPRASAFLRRLRRLSVPSQQPSGRSNHCRRAG